MIERERDGSYRQPLGIGQYESAASGIGELTVERCGRQRYGTRARGVVGICCVNHEPVCREPAFSQTAPELLREQTEQGKEDPQVIGLGGERVAHVKLRLPLRW
jgi:hypothetical protein